MGQSYRVDQNGRAIVEDLGSTGGALRPFPEVSGRRYRPKGDEVLVRLDEKSNPPQEWDLSTPNPADPSGKTRWYWLFLVLVLGLMIYLV